MDAEIWGEVVSLHARVEGELGKALQRRHRLGLTEYRALRVLVASGGELRMQELAELIGLNQSSVSRLAARLEADGLSRRDLCPDDRRGVNIVITDGGRALQQEAAPTYDETLGSALDRDSGELVRRLRG